MSEWVVILLLLKVVLCQSVGHFVYAYWSRGWFGRLPAGLPLSILSACVDVHAYIDETLSTHNIPYCCSTFIIITCVCGCLCSYLYNKINFRVQVIITPLLSRPSGVRLLGICTYFLSWLFIWSYFALLQLNEVVLGLLAYYVVQLLRKE